MTLLDSQLDSKGPDLSRFIKGNHFGIAKNSGEVKSAMLNRTYSLQEEGLRKQAEEVVRNIGKPAGPASGPKKIGDVEIEVKGNNTNGLIFNYVLHHSELSGFAGKGGLGRVFINSYLGKC